MSTIHDIYSRSAVLTPARRDRRRALLGATSLLALPLMALALASCGGSSPTLSTVTVERAVAESILTERHVYTLVSCPAKIPQQQGHTFTCKAMLTVGAYPVSVTETDGSGHVRWDSKAPLVVLNESSVENAIRQSVLTERGVHATVSCPANVLQQQGLSFTCTAHVKEGNSKVKGGSYPFTVTETDSSGHVRFVGH